MAAELGLDAIEPLSADFPSASERFLTELRERLARTPVEISAIAVVNDFAHPDAAYFNLGPLGRDQVADYARRKGMDLAEAERWLAPALAYDPASTVQRSGEGEAATPALRA